MTVATGSLSDLGYALETTYGTAPTGTVYKSFRRKSAAGLNLTKDAYISEEIRVDRQLSDSRHGIRRSGGDVESEVSPNSFRPFFASLMGQDASTGTQGWTAAPASFSGTSATGATVTAGILAIAGIVPTLVAGDFLPGGLVILSGMTELNPGGNNNDYVVLGMNTATSTLYLTPSGGTGTPPVEGASVGSIAPFSIVRLSERIKVGGTRTSYTLERAFTDVDKYQNYTGCVVNSASFSLPPTGIAGITWNFLGKNASGMNSAPVSTVEGAYTTVSTTPVLAAVSGRVALRNSSGVMVASGLVTGLDFTIDNQMGGSEVVGSNTIPEALFGNTQLVTGKATVLFDGTAFYNLFESELDSTLVFVMIGPGGNQRDHIGFCFPRCKFSSASIGDAVATGLPLEMDFQALRPTDVTNVAINGAASTNIDSQVFMFTNAAP